MRGEEVLVTPAMATAWLEHNTANRTLSATRVARYKAEILAGQFLANGQPVIFGESGRLLDGQHRLKAIVEAGVPVKLFVVRGVSDSTFHTLDRGKAREVADVLSIQGQRNAASLGSAVKWVIRYENGSTAHHFHGSMQEVIETLEAHPALPEHVQKARQYYNKGLGVPPGLAGALWYLFSRSDVQLADWFFTRLFSGEGIQSPDPVWMLRETILRNRVLLKGGGSTHDVPLAAVIIKAWNATLQQKPVKVLRFSTDETFPVIAA